MATCKECLHQPVCDMYANLGVTDFSAADITPCELFKPSADVAKVNPGKWKRRIDHDLDCECITCSVCSKEFCPPNNEWVFYDLPNYCSNCGAKMKTKKG